MAQGFGRATGHAELAQLDLDTTGSELLNDLDHESVLLLLASVKEVVRLVGVGGEVVNGCSCHVTSLMSMKEEGIRWNGTGWDVYLLSLRPSTFRLHAQREREWEW